MDRRPDEDTYEDDQDEELEGEWELDPNDPSHPDHDLSVSAGYAGWEPEPKPVLLWRGVVVGLTLLIVLGLLIPTLLLFRMF